MNDTNQTRKSVTQITNQIIREHLDPRFGSSASALLASLRHSADKSFSETMSIWPILFSLLPEDQLSPDGRPTYTEAAVIYALQLYAIHQQGKAQLVHADTSSMQQVGNIGKALSVLRKQDDSVAIDRRFNRLVLSDTIERLVYQLRQCVKMLRSRSEVKVDYGQLAQDLLAFQYGRIESIRINWARSYYQTKAKEEKGEE